MRRRDGTIQLLGGLAILTWGLLAAVFVSVGAYGGVWKAPMVERVLWFSPAIAAVVVGVAMIVGGVLRLVRGRGVSQRA